MDQQNSMNENAKAAPIKINFDDFNINEDSFKPVNKGLGFHQEQKRQNTFKQAPREVSAFQNQSAPKIKTSALLNEISSSNKEASTKSVPTGLEAFYGATAKPAISEVEINKVLDTKIFQETNKVETASAIAQFTAWILDVALVLSFSAITTTLLILVSGMSFANFLKVIPLMDLAVFGGVLFSIYYLLYFTILDLSTTPGKTIVGIRLVRLDNKQVSVKHTFIRSLVTLLSFIALFLPMIIDFQGRLSDTKVIK